MSDLGSHPAARASLKDFCIDATSPVPVAKFWAAAIGGEVDVDDAGEAFIRRGKAVDIWVNRVPEAKGVKNRVHFDVYTRAVADLVALGATLLEEHEPDRVVMADIEGNEFCAFLDPDLESDTPARLFALCTDSDKPAEIARWWHDRVGGTLTPGPDGTLRWLREAAGWGDLIWKFVRVADARVVKNRWHWDVHGDAAELVREGARALRGPDTDIHWTVLIDPDGNEFCAFG
ncbi:VOC family protein [Mycobacteroides abscessus]|uniref:VOC family protein n=1 Tax=Mycobacteroides abscessus TaxID=36809 RepID=UPI00266D5C4F|nr:VOC family protein [Mycobacteroides abscessus]MDO2968171.1 VOC family protein [Mycobacteroides abscessus subsp. bolletii]MDO3080395.1 VOC family protein [Mycobacteroides abscessus subsp. bolletii]